MTAAQNVAELFTEDEWVRFVEAGREHARAQGSTFFLDETAQIISARAWATYLRDVMTVVGVEDLAARIVPENYPHHTDEKESRRG